MHILIVEDEPHIARLIQYNLDKSGFTSHVVDNGNAVLGEMARHTYDLVILDIMLPGKDGLELCKTLKGLPQYTRVPIIFVTAKGEEIDRILGFEVGADDYLVKPFSPRELMLRIQAIMKRTQPVQAAESLHSRQIVIHNLVIDRDRHQVTVQGEPIVLTKMEYDLLNLLIDRRGRIQSRQTLLNDCWDIAADVTTRTVDTHIKRLRQKLGEMGDYIETRRGFGYRFKD